MTPLLVVDSIECRFGSRTIVEELSFSVNEGEISSLLGPSGCGKTTLLQAIAGFNPIHTGTIQLQGRTIAQVQDALPPEQRGIGMVFQDYALFPHLSVHDNLGFGLKKLPRRERDARIAEALELVQLSHLADRYPHQLSGGQQQRVALARALAPKPRLLLMDEPFSNLDTELRRTLATEVRDILKRADMTAIMVTHDRDEAFAISDHIGVLDNGRLLQWDRPEVIYHQPATPVVASFVGDGAFMEGNVREDGWIETELGVLPNPGDHWPVGVSLDIFVRPDEITVDNTGVEARILSRAFLGTQTRYTFQLASGRRLDAVFRALHRFSEGDKVRIKLHTDHLVAFPSKANLAGLDWQSIETDPYGSRLVANI